MNGGFTMKRLRRCKIIATLGPASSDKSAIAALWAAGADVFRINMSHSDHTGMRERVRLIRETELEVGRPIAILADLQGPKLRLGQFWKVASSSHRVRLLRSIPIQRRAMRKGCNCHIQKSWRRFGRAIAC
jgi:pyruvate kinase